jgi:hypothetical protein
MSVSRRSFATLAAAAFVAAGCAATGAPVPNENTFAGVYGTTLVAASGGGERIMTLTLDLDRTATLATRFVGREGETVDRGTWSAVGERVTVHLATAGDRRAPQRLAFELRGDALVPVSWDRVLWGEAGPGTYRRK